MKNKETLEEAAEKYCLINNIPIDQMIVKNDRSCEFETPVTMFINGAKWQQERSHSEAIEFAEWIRIKDLQTASKDNWIGLDMKYYTTEELFEQFKKK